MYEMLMYLEWCTQLPHSSIHQLTHPLFFCRLLERPDTAHHTSISSYSEKTLQELPLRGDGLVNPC